MINLKMMANSIGTVFVFLALLITPATTLANLGSNDPLPRLNNKPLENITGVETIYGSVEVEPGVRLRTLISRPKNTAKPLHPLLFAQWVSCGSIELKPGDGGKLGMIARESGLALVRVDRAGSGDSQGPSCDQLDYDTEVAHYIAAFDKLMKDPILDSSKVFLLGDSLGSTTAPLIALALQNKDYDIAGIVVQGGGALTHVERMIHFDRFYLERRLKDVPRADIHAQMNQRIAFQTEYLVKGRHPDEIAKDSDAMLAIRNDVRGLDKDNHYGRPFTWHQQAAQRNFLEVWDSLDTKVLVIFNEYDQFETRHGHELIVETINQKAPGNATLVVQKGLDHSSWRFDSKEDAYIDNNGESATASTGKVTVEWLQKVLGK